ncbi:TPA: HD domain-containing protein [archaeon]|uniref:HD domain-containing protein n=1 Tax=Candidatus Naiadarchaeum limnaeum TaxID=2756139 RepID=A0A832UQM2_9ARCH|nr:HD domain-containing protein [Candidatus Naiadarchaeales archaeon SRR2090153.bin1042]HIJ99941.1 HD domain-containing protein [Candidatus Naiadarchaeum limnaeum]
MKTLKDPIHGNIHFSDDEVRILDAPELQRLRNIKQLGLSYLVYPSATHSRFEHSIGTYFLANKLAASLKLSKEDVQKVRLAALLHDIGHGPFSHSSERAILTRFDSKFSHERNTARILKKSPISDYLKEIGFSGEEIAKIAVEGKSKFSEIVSGEIDVDRMDYLVRDSYYTGAAYGTIDLDRLIDTLQLKTGRLVFSENGFSAAESMVLARYLMYPSVYEHHTTRIADTMFTYATASALEDKIFTPEELYSMDDIELISRLRELEGTPAHLVERIESRKLYKRAISFSKEDLGKSFLKFLRINPKQALKLERELLNKCKLSAGEVILDIPDPLYVKEARAKIFWKGKIRELSNVSPLVKALSAAQWSYWNIAVYCDSQNLGKVQKAAKKVLL